VNFRLGTYLLLLAQHHTQLRESGIAPEVALARGYFSARSESELAGLGFAPYQRRIPALVIPIFNSQGLCVGHQARPDKPRTSSNGKTIKYETPQGSRLQLDCHPAIHDRVIDQSIPLLITEGTKKGDAAVSHGFCCLSLSGVWCWQSKGEPLEDWDLIPLTNRHIYIAFDSDVTIKDSVKDALEALVHFLASREAVVHILDLGAGGAAGAQKVGLDDYLAAGADLKELMNRASVEGPMRDHVEIFPAAQEAEDPASINDLHGDGDWPAPPATEAFYGLAGDVVSLIDPYSEADRVAVLAQFLGAFGAVVGHGPHFQVGATRHEPRLFIAIIGPTSRGRKGSSWDPLEYLFTEADSTFRSRILDGVGSGEVLIHLVRDPELGEGEQDKKPDKRVLLMESELSRILVAVHRADSMLSQNLRLAFDGKPMRNLVKHDGAVASTHHIALVGHSTASELRGHLTEDQIRNGLGNRIAFFLSRRDKQIPTPQAFSGAAVKETVVAVQRQLKRARLIGVMKRSPKAERLWDEWYRSLRDDDPGTVGALTARAEAHVLRFSLTYGLADASPVVQVEHLKAALALWDYSVRSVSQIFGETTGNAIADRIRDELKIGPLTQTEIFSDVFNRNISGRDLQTALNQLESQGKVLKTREPKQGRGRPITRWSFKP
jgi:hypothetical protein